jgi:hypothetical protein
VDEIIARRSQRQRQIVKAVVDDAEAAVAVVQGLDKLFTDILNQFLSARVVEDNTALADLVDESGKFLLGRTLLPVLDTQRAAIRAATGDTSGDAKKLKPLRPQLERMADALDAYREVLGRAANTAPGQLGRVYQLALTRVNSGTVTTSQIIEHATAVRDEHDFTASERIYVMQGELRQAARA